MKQVAPQKRGDYTLVLYIVILITIGLFMLASAGALGGYFKKETFFYVSRQIQLGVLPGIVLFFFFAKVPYRFLERLALPIFLGCLGLLLLVFVPGIGSTHNTVARNWISLFGFSLQPAECAKLGLVLFFAKILSTHDKHLWMFFRGFLRIAVLGFVPAVLVAMQPDIGSASILFAIAFGMLFVAETPGVFLAGTVGLGALVGGVLATISQHIQERVATFWHVVQGDLTSDSRVGTQVYHALLALGSGGLFGLGYGHSRQKFGYLPEVHADSIFAIIGEEMGLVFSLGFLVLWVLIGLRMLKIAQGARDTFGMYAVYGILTWFFVQTFLNVGAMMGIVPLTGVPLPFISHGGTALTMAMGAVGVVYAVSKERASRTRI